MNLYVLAMAVEMEVEVEVEVEDEACAPYYLRGRAWSMVPLFTARL